MYCKKCGSLIPDDTLFCTNCNTFLELSTKRKASEEPGLPPIPPSFTRQIPTNELSRSKRKELKPPRSRGTGCLVFSLIFLLLCIGFVASLFISDKIKENSFFELTNTSATEASTTEPATALKTETEPQATESAKK